MGQNQKWLHHPYRAGSPDLSGGSTKPVRSWLSKKRGGKYITDAFSGAGSGRNCYIRAMFLEVPRKGVK